MVGLYNFLSRYGQVVAFVVGLVLIVAYLMTVQSGLEEFNALGKEDQAKTTIFNIGLMSAIGLIIAAVVLVFLFALFDLVFNPKNSLRSLALLLFIGLLFFLGYSMAQADEAGKLAELYQKYQITPFIAKLIGGGLRATIWLGILAVVAVIVTEIGLGPYLASLLGKKN